MTVGLSTVLPFETPKSSFTTKVGTRKYRLCVSYGFEPRTFWFSMNQISHCSSAAKCFDLIYYLYPPLVYNSETIMKREPRVYRYKLCITKVFHSRNFQHTFMLCSFLSNLIGYSKLYKNHEALSKRHKFMLEFSLRDQP